MARPELRSSQSYQAQKGECWRMAHGSKWHFIEKPVGQKAREAIQGEFFKDQSIDDSLHALIRETVQNSLDARSGSDPVHIVISLGRLAARDSIVWFPETSQRHFAAPEIGLTSLPNWGRESCSYLTIEDFGTCGLEGKVDSDKPSLGGNFYHFFRAEGVSNKSEGHRGSWGVGKIVIPAASRARTFFAMTRRRKDPVLYAMGQTVLRYHSVDECEYTPDAWFGEISDDGLPTAFRDDSFTQRMISDFRLCRTTEPGLGLIIPWVDANISLEKLAETVAREYFMPILSGDLVVDMRDHDVDGEIRFDYGSVGALGKACSNNTEFQDVLRLASCLFGVSDESVLEVDVVSSDEKSKVNYDWTEMSVGVPVGDVDNALEIGRVVHFKTPMVIENKTVGSTEFGSFDVLLLRKEGRHYPVFVREGLLIANHNSRKKTAGHVALIYAGDFSGTSEISNIVANTLRLAECPAHTDWNPAREKFKGVFADGRRLIPFVRDSAVRLIEKLAGDETTPDRNMLADLLPLPEDNAPIRPDAGKATGRSEKVTPPAPGDIPPLPKSKPRCWKIQQNGKVVQIRGSREGFQHVNGYELTIHAAYDLPGRNPFKVHSKYDFELGRAAAACNVKSKGVGVDSTGFKVSLDGGVRFFKSESDFEMVVHVDSPDFNIALEPSDLNRDLKVEVRSQPVTDHVEFDE